MNKYNEMYYIVSVRGLKPAYYSKDQWESAFINYSYCKKHFAGTSIVIVPKRRVQRDFYTGRTL